MQVKTKDKIMEQVVWIELTQLDHRTEQLVISAAGGKTLTKPIIKVISSQGIKIRTWDKMN
jgi:hypothetical protein